MNENNQLRARIAALEAELAAERNRFIRLAGVLVDMASGHKVTP